MKSMGSSWENLTNTTGTEGVNNLELQNYQHLYFLLFRFIKTMFTVKELVLFLVRKFFVTLDQSTATFSSFPSTHYPKDTWESMIIILI